MIDNILEDRKFLENKTFSEDMDYLKSFGFSELFGIDRHDMDFFDTVANSKYLQVKWAKENNIKFDEDNWQKEILAFQIEKFKPDVIYTANHVFFDNEMKKYLPKVGLYALWNASVMSPDSDVKHFDVGISFNKVYHEQLIKYGIKNVEFNSFFSN